MTVEQVAIEVSGDLRANNGDALLAAAIAGQGIIYQPAFIVAGSLRSGELVSLALDQPTVELGGIYAVFLPNRHPAALRPRRLRHCHASVQLLRWTSHLRRGT